MKARTPDSYSNGLLEVVPQAVSTNKKSWENKRKDRIKFSLESNRVAIQNQSRVRWKLIMDFVVLDTEGKPELRELALFDSQGRVIYQGFSCDHPNNVSYRPNLKSLKTLLEEFSNIVRGKKIVCHYAEHDIEVLEYFGKYLCWVPQSLHPTYSL